jgi:hypothetical protein
MQSILETLETPSGYWDPLMWLFGLAVAIGFALFIRSLGEKSYLKGTEQTKPFISGNPELSKSASQVRASNLYWGFMESLESYYSKLMRFHTGNVNDYVLLLVWVIAVMFLVVILLGGIYG